MKILVINCGSSSVKFQLIETSPPQIASNTDRFLAKGEVERLGSSEAIISFELAATERVRESRPIRDHTQAIQAALEKLKIGRAHV